MPSDAVDLENLQLLKELLADRFAELVDTYLSDSSTRFASLCNAIENGDMKTVQHEAHGLKGSSKNIGANPLADLCSTLETQARDGDIKDCEQQLAAIEKNIATVTDELKNLL